MSVVSDIIYVGRCSVLSLYIIALGLMSKGKNLCFVLFRERSLFNFKEIVKISFEDLHCTFYFGSFVISLITSAAAVLVLVYVCEKSLLWKGEVDAKLLQSWILGRFHTSSCLKQLNVK